MNTALCRLIYISTLQIEGGDAAVQAEIDNILDVAREANAAADITGALMFNNGCFAQILEGKLDNVEETFERIQCDERHADVVILSLETVEQRRFSSWSMGYVGNEKTVAEQFERIRIESGFDPKKVPSDSIFNLLHQNLIEAEAKTPDPARKAA